MKRIASTILTASLLALAGPVAVAPVWSGGVAWAEVSDKEMEDQLACQGIAGMVVKCHEDVKCS